MCARSNLDNRQVKICTLLQPFQSGYLGGWLCIRRDCNVFIWVIKYEEIYWNGMVSEGRGARLELRNYYL